jgi:hypothetical protein
MERLTEKCGDRWIPRQDIRNNGHDKCMEKLAEYEDTGLTPEDIITLKGLNKKLIEIADDNISQRKRLLAEVENYRQAEEALKGVMPID